jgi:hypothetical protein
MELKVTEYPDCVHIRGNGPCNWAQGPTLLSAEPFAEAGPMFRQRLEELKNASAAPKEG